MSIGDIFIKTIEAFKKQNLSPPKAVIVDNETLNRLKMMAINGTDGSVYYREGKLVFSVYDIEIRGE